MLINDKDAAARLTSPANLINKLRSSDNPRKNAMNLFGMGRPSAEKLEIKPIEVKPKEIEIKKEELAVISSFNPFATKTALIPKEESPKLEELIENSDSQVKLALAHDNALKLLNSSVALLATKLDEVSASKLPGVITAASKVVDNIRKERREAASGSEREVHYHFYTPQQRKVSDYEVIDVSAS